MNDEKSIDNNQEVNDWWDEEFDRREANLEWMRLIDSNPELLFEMINGHPRQHVREGSNFSQISRSGWSQMV